MPPIKGRRTDANSLSAPGSRPNTIGVPLSSLGDLLDFLDNRTAEGDASVKRTHARWPFRQASLLTVLEHPGGSLARIHVACRNLSRGGAGLLHSAYVHLGTSCTVHLPKLDGTIHMLPGTIVRCTHLRGVVHELGVSFREPIRLSEYVELDPLIGGSSFERVDPSNLAGSVLVVTVSEIDERIIGHYLAETKLNLKFARDTAEAVARATEGCEVIMMDLSIEDAPEILACLRQKGCTAPVIAIGEQANRLIRHQLQSMEVSAFLIKPLNNDLLLGALAECILIDDGSMLVPEAMPGASIAVMKNCVDLVHSLATELRDALVLADATRCLAISQQIRGAAVQLGLREVVAVAESACAQATQGLKTPESAERINVLVRTCQRIRAPRMAG